MLSSDFAYYKVSLDTVSKTQRNNIAVCSLRVLYIVNVSCIIDKTRRNYIIIDIFWTSSPNSMFYVTMQAY